MELLTLSRSELDRLAALRRYQAGGLTQEEVALQLGLSERQVRRLLRRLEANAEAGIVSRRRGRPSNNRLDPELLEAALTLVRRHYADFGPTFTNEKLRERHDLVLSTESLRRAMMHAGLWKPRKHRQPKLHPPRQRRPCRGELVQVDGSDRRGQRLNFTILETRPDQGAIVAATGSPSTSSSVPRRTPGSRQPTTPGDDLPTNPSLPGQRTFQLSSDRTLALRPVKRSVSHEDDRAVMSNRSAPGVPCSISCSICAA